jgi:hypothetical protein
MFEFVVTTDATPKFQLLITTRLTSLPKRDIVDIMVTTHETVGFIRVRRRKLKPQYQWYTPKRGRYAGISRKVENHEYANESRSYDLVRAVRINGQPRHKFVLGFGSPKSRWIPESMAIPAFWTRSFARMEKHGFNKEQRFAIAEMLASKGIPLPTVKECRKEKVKWGTERDTLYDEVIAFVRRS